MTKTDKKTEATKRILDTADKVVQTLTENLDHRHEALAAIRAAEAVVASFPGSDRDPDALAY